MSLTAKQKAEEKKLLAKRLGRRLRKVRKERKLSQEELAYRADYYRTYIGHIETARHSPSVHTMWRIANALEIDLGELLKGL